jgi:hypothetical protein
MVHFLLSIYNTVTVCLFQRNIEKMSRIILTNHNRAAKRNFARRNKIAVGPRGQALRLLSKLRNWVDNTTQKKRQKDMGHFRDSWLSGPRTDIPAEPPSHRTWITKCVLIHSICRRVYTFSISFFSYLHKKIQKTKIKIPHCRNSSKIQ